MKYRAPDDSDQKRLRDDLNGYRRCAGLTLPQMAAKLGIPAFRLEKIEKGIQPCPEDLVLKASEISQPTFVEYPDPEEDENPDRDAPWGPDDLLWSDGF